MLKKHKYKNRTFHLGPEIYDNLNNENKYTVIVGENGTGKSRLLKSIVEEFIGGTNRRGYHDDIASLNQTTSRLSVSYNPTNIIAVSTSPFDKFPITRRMSEEKSLYKYLGLRNLRSTDLGQAYMTKIFTSLVESVIYNHSAATKIVDVLSYLGYERHIEARYRLEYSRRRMEEVFASEDPVDFFINKVLESRNIIHSGINRRCFTNENREFDITKVENFLSVYRKVIKDNDKPRLQILINDTGVSSNNFGIDFECDFSYLVNVGALRLRDITLKKVNVNMPFFIGDASSGEQSIVMSILGIASKIENGSLICIDEPEVCLHPRWQEKYLELLINTFRDYSNCHFLIATHSPLIVSKLQDKNCYLMSMEDGLLCDSTEVNRRSVDFQLAKVFKSPGFKNEFLTRVLMSFLATYSETGEIEDNDVVTIRSILTLKNKISENDPVRQLMYMVEDIIEGEY